MTPEPRDEMEKQSEELLGLLQSPAADAYSATCPNPSPLERCANAGVLNSFNHVVRKDVKQAKRSED